MLPIVVLDARLYDYTLDVDNGGILQRKDEVLIDAALRAEDLSYVRVITIEALERLISVWTREITGFCDALLPHAAEVVANVRDRNSKDG